MSASPKIHPSLQPSSPLKKKATALTLNKIQPALQPPSPLEKKTTTYLTPEEKKYAIPEDDPRFKSVMERASFFDFLHFGFAFTTMKKALRLHKVGKTLIGKDLPGLGYEDRAEVLKEKFLANIKKQKANHKKVSLGWAILDTFKFLIVKVLFLQTFFIFNKIFSVWIMKMLLDSLVDSSKPVSEDFTWAGILCILVIIAMYSEHHYWYQATLAPTHIKGALISMIYNKVSKISVHSLNKISLGKIVNVVSNDLNVFERTGYFLTSLVTGPIALLASGALLWIFFGPACLAGIVIVIIGFPVQQHIAKIATKPRDLKNKATDERVKVTNEIIEGIRILKMYTWELIFRERVHRLREREIALLKKVMKYEGSSRGIAYCTQAVASFLIFMTFVLTGGDLTVSVVYPALSLVGYIRTYAVTSFASALIFIAEVELLFERILIIMEAPEVTAKAPIDPIKPENAIEFDNFSANWDKDENFDVHHASSLLGTTIQTTPERGQLYREDTKATLYEVNTSIQHGSLTGIVGKVGSGKSSLLLSLTGEMPFTYGELRSKGRIAYVEQEPTIFAGTLRENILFGREYDEEFYQKVIKGCCLETDLTLFANGDMTEIGEKGVNLSGGQKARLALARAVYSDADIYLLDDPLSAVDAKVAQKLFLDAILGLLGKKTVLLATHQVHFVKDCKHIIIVENGRILGNASYDELKKNGIPVNNIFSIQSLRKATSLSSRNMGSLVNSGAANKFNLKNNRTSILVKPEARGSVLMRHGSKSKNSLPSKTLLTPSFKKIKEENNDEDEDEIIENFDADDHEEEEEEEEEEDDEIEEEEEGEKKEDEKGKLFTTEDKFAGEVNAKTYLSYLRKMGTTPVLIFAFLTFLSCEIANIGFSRVIGLWANATISEEASLIIMGCLTLFIMTVYIVKNIMFNLLSLRASQGFHDKMVEKITRAPVEFFDTNPLGRILNRFSNDVGVVDKGLSSFTIDVVEVSFTVVSQIITIAVITLPTLAPAFVTSIAIAFVLKFSYQAIKQCRSYDLVSRSPLYSSLSSTLSGLIVIRAYGQEKNFESKFVKILNDNTKGNISFRMTSRLFGFLVDYLYNISAIISIMIVVSMKGGDAGLSGLSLSYILSIAGTLQSGLRQAVQANVLMVSVARVQGYCDIPSEADLVKPSDKELKEVQWPKDAKISFKDVFMRYRSNTDHIVKGLSFDAKAGEKIACIGRTGAGKSTIIQILFRMVEIDRQDKSKEESYVKIDGIDSQDLGLHLLRNNIAIIPQTPYIFSGDVRKNLDPLNLYSDEDLWRVLEDVGLKQYVEKFDRGLHTDMGSAASIFSVGQKQLICLARAILKKCKILVLDEATANVDMETDKFIQRKITEKFSHCTVFTIAHRLSTIAGYDKVLVLDQGQKVEFDEPFKLLVNKMSDKTITNTNGHFASMVLNTGPKSSQLIFSLARSAYRLKHSEDEEEKKE